VIELYDKFFKTAFPRMSDRLGIVYTPIEVVDFIIRSADYALRDHFRVGLTDSNVHILDPFAGTGTFLVRLLQSGLIRSGDLPRKYRDELHANEVVLLAYYIAAINIESVYQTLTSSYESFNGIVLTDTFQMGEKEHKFFGKEYLPENNERVRRQKERDIRVIIGNPPYRVNQGDSNENNQNLSYERLDQSIRNTYAAHSTATLKNSLYDSYIRAFRWASNRIKKQGVICYISNGGWIDGNTMDGFRKTLFEEFTSIYVFNLRGNARTQGELRRKEGGNVFNSGSRAPIAITLLVKNPDQHGPCEIHYHDIGDYLTREEKLAKVVGFRSIENVPWEKIVPNPHHDWINARSEEFEALVPLNDGPNSIFTIRSNGVKTNRDTWVYNFSLNNLKLNMEKTARFYEAERTRLHGQKGDFTDLVRYDPTQIKWEREMLLFLKRDIPLVPTEDRFRIGMYRPFTKQNLGFGDIINNCTYQMPSIFPSPHYENLAISVTGTGSSKNFSCLIVNVLPDLEVISKGQCFPLYVYEKSQAGRTGRNRLSIFLKEESPEAHPIKRDAISDSALMNFQAHYQDKKITKEDLFYYVYGVLHSPEYRERFGTDLKKMLPRIPFVLDFWGFSKAGRELAHWHLNYETVDPWPLEEKKDNSVLSRMTPKEFFRVEEMKFGKSGKEKDKTTIFYNSRVTLSGIPLEAYEYVVNGKPALEWVMERYAVKVDKDSGIKNDPNAWSEDPRYILDLVKRIVRVSLETVRIVREFPTLTEQGNKKPYTPAYFGGESIAAEEEPE
jgi:predicted helicase